MTTFVDVVSSASSKKSAKKSKNEGNGNPCAHVSCHLGDLECSCWNLSYWPGTSKGFQAMGRSLLYAMVMTIALKYLRNGRTDFYGINLIEITLAS